MPKRKLPDLYCCPCCNVVPLDGEPCTCVNQLQLGRSGHYSARRWPPIAVREAQDVVVRQYEGPIILPMAERT